MLPFRTGLDLAGEVDRALPGAELAVPTSVLGELERLAARRVPFALPAVTLARSFRALSTSDRGDAAVLSTARRFRARVVTADRALTVRLRAAGIDVLLPRDRTRLELRPGRSTDRPALPARRRTHPTARGRGNR